MKRSELKRKTPLLTRTGLVRRQSLQAKASGKRQGFGKPRAISPASTAQRAKTRGTECIVCEQQHAHQTTPSDPAHVVPRSMGGCDSPDCVVALCRFHHQAVDGGQLDLLAYLEPAYRVEQMHAVGHIGIARVYRQLTNERRAA